MDHGVSRIVILCLAALVIPQAVFATSARLTPSSLQVAGEQRGLRTSTPEASPGYVIFNPNRSPTTYLVDLEGRVVHVWQSDYGPGGGAYLLDNGHLLRGVREPDVPVFSGGG